MQLSLVPDTIFTLGPVAISSSHIAMWVVTAIIIVFGLYISKNASLIPTTGQVVLEGVYDWFEEKVLPKVTYTPRAEIVLHYIITLFLIIFISNFLGFIPFIMSVGYQTADSFIPFLKTPTSHLSMTLALGLMTVVGINIVAFTLRPIRYILNYIRVEPLFHALKKADFAAAGLALIDIFLGFMDIIGEFAKIVSISCRLFGNLISGELMMAVILGLAVFTNFVAPVFFIMLGMISGAVQPIVFTLLSTSFVTGLLSVADPDDA